MWAAFADEGAAGAFVLPDGSVISRCDQCKQIYSGRKPPQEPPCDVCRTDLDPVNEDAGMVFMLTRGQIIPGYEGRPVDINIVAVRAVMDIYGIENQQDCLNKVLLLFRDHQRREVPSGEAA